MSVDPVITSPAPLPLAATFVPPKAFATLKCNNSDNTLSNEQVFYLVGTAHISRASCEDVRQVIRAIQPEVVMLELCPERRAVLVAEAMKVATLSEALADWRTGNVGLFQALYSWFLGQAATQLEVVPGEEFRVAVEEARKIGAKVVLGDRPLRVTLARLWASLSLWDRAWLVGTLLFTGLKLPGKEELDEMLEGLKENDIMTAAIEELGRSMPAFKRVLITERDQFMVYMMRKLSQRATRVVGVVGAGHLPGIRTCWEEHIPMEELMRMPDKRQPSRWPMITLLGVACSGVLVTSLVIRWRR